MSSNENPSLYVHNRWMEIVKPITLCQLLLLSHSSHVGGYKYYDSLVKNKSQSSQTCIY
jgi:hypothetical protein